MILALLRRALAMGLMGLAILGVGLVGSPRRVEGGTRRVDPAQVLPMHLLAPEMKDSVSEVISSHTFHRQGASDTFTCNPQVYLCLLNEPALTLALWKDLWKDLRPLDNHQLQQVGPDRYQGTDGEGATATWNYAYRSPRLTVLLCELDYVGPRGNLRLNGRIVVIVRTEYFRKNSDDVIRHQVEMFVKIDSPGWRTAAKTVRPVVEKKLEEQVQEAGEFVSLMAGIVEQYPTWASQVAQQGADIRPELRRSFPQLVAQHHRPGARAGRPPVVAENEDAARRVR